jgi:hypothetical protein
MSEDPNLKTQKQKQAWKPKKDDETRYYKS